MYDAILDWPLPYEDLTVETSFGPTYVRRSGGDGEPLVLLHGMSDTSLMWQPYVAGLGPDHALYAVDSMGKPGRTVQTAPMLDARSNADWLAEVLDGLGHDKVHLVGLSRGGWLALNQAIHAPERVSRVTVFDPAGFFRSWRKVRGYLVLGLLRLARLVPDVEVEIVHTSHGLGLVEPAFLRDRILGHTRS
ncbi:alpha/beta fold hydrolase [Amycolatopsis aidingensis]|uniref:alpha/beta fold hydrolase n=1 Tax=Amycolatopsis aidingensis TaxID=2842453 RepID=UPI001C0D8178|nr:alpha/beta fold hydrolase [Amycolatopsis aidingensis]